MASAGSGPTLPLAPASVAEPGADSVVRPGTKLGRYLTIGRIAEGGMGTVLRAYDPRLEREVALKLVRPDRRDPGMVLRAVREARALAQLNHPNVVAVYDVDIDSAGEVCMAMELVRGSTLQEWLDAEPRRPDEILAVLLTAGRGLAAAHAVGMLHRDFKPANVLVGDDGRTRVSDFGLARIDHSHSARSAERAALLTRPGVDSDALTAHGTVMGTPAYMAPEQHRGAELDARADQYAFCVTAWEALTGARPFEGNLAALAEAKHRRPPPWPRPRGVPAWVGAALHRGLMPDPAARWPDMSTLLEVLSPRHPRRAAWGLALAAVAITGAIAFSASSRPEPCTGAQAALEPIWSAGRRERIAEAIARTGLPFAESTAARVLPALDAYGSAWVEQHTDACLATNVRAEQSQQILDLRMTCLSASARELDAVVELFEQAELDAPLVARADQLVGALPRVHDCSDLERLRADVEPPQPEQADAVATVRDLVARASVLRRAGRPADARTAIEAAVEAGARVDYAPLRAELDLERGQVKAALGEYSAACTTLREALRSALLHQQSEVATVAILQLAHAEGYGGGRVDVGLALSEVARGMVEREGSFVSRTRLHNNLATLHQIDGDFAAAEREALTALQAREADVGPAHPETARMRSNLASMLFSQGRHAEAGAQWQQAVSALEAAFGPNHLDLATVRGNLGLVYKEQGQLDPAAAEYTRAIEIASAALGPDHPEVASHVHNLGVVRQYQGDLEGAERDLRRALAVFDHAYPPVHPRVLLARGSLAGLLEAKGELEEAEALARQVLDARLDNFAEAHPDVASAQNNLAAMLVNRHRWVEAEPLARAAVATFVATEGDLVRERSAARMNLFHALVGQGREREAREVIDEILAEGDALKAVDPGQLAEARAAAAGLEE